MPWGKIDDSAHEHRKFRRAGLEATGLYWMAVSYSARYLTDGRVHGDWLEARVPHPKKRVHLLHVLVEHELFEENGSGYVIHDYLDHNPSKQEVLDRREKQAEKKRKQRMSPGDRPGDDDGDF